MRLITVLAFSAIALAACNKTTNNSNNSNNSNNALSPAANKNSSTPATTGGYSTPAAALKTFYEASKATNIEGVKRSMSKKAMDEITKSAARENKTVDDSLREIIKDAPANMPAMRDEKIEGDKASAEVKDEKMDKWTRIYFVREGGQWKLALDEEKSADIDKMDHEGMEKK